MWLMAAFIASWVACICVGVILHAWFMAAQYRPPEHPAVRFAEHHRRWRVIEGGRLYDQDKDREGRGA